MKRLAIIHFKDGTSDLIDPIGNAENDVFYGDTTIIVTSAANYKYDYDKALVENVEIIESED